MTHILFARYCFPGNENNRQSGNKSPIRKKTYNIFFLLYRYNDNNYYYCCCNNNNNNNNNNIIDLYRSRSPARKVFGFSRLFGNFRFLLRHSSRFEHRSCAYVTGTRSFDVQNRSYDVTYARRRQVYTSLLHGVGALLLLHVRVCHVYRLWTWVGISRLPASE